MMHTVIYSRYHLTIAEENKEHFKATEIETDGFSRNCNGGMSQETFRLQSSFEPRQHLLPPFLLCRSFVLQPEMAPSQQYDEGGDMASYFIITLLALILIPLSISQLLASLRSFNAPRVDGCRCTACIAQREASRKRRDGTWLKPKITNK